MTDPHEPPSGSPPSPRRELRRSAGDRVLVGVCGGLGAYLGIDSVLVRILFVVLALFGGSGVLLYVIAWILMPAEQPPPAVTAGGGAAGSGQTQSAPGQDRSPHSSDPHRPDARIIVGAVLLVVGVVLFAGQALPAVRQFIGPLVLIVIGLLLLAGWRR